MYILRSLPPFVPLISSLASPPPRTCICLYSPHHHLSLTDKNAQVMSSRRTRTQLPQRLQEARERQRDLAVRLAFYRSKFKDFKREVVEAEHVANTYAVAYEECEARLTSVLNDLGEETARRLRLQGRVDHTVRILRTALRLLVCQVIIISHDHH